MDRGAWEAAVHVVEKSQTRLRDFTFTLHFHALDTFSHICCSSVYFGEYVCYTALLLLSRFSRVQLCSTP